MRAETVARRLLSFPRLSVGKVRFETDEVVSGNSAEPVRAGMMRSGAADDGVGTARFRRAGRPVALVGIEKLALREEDGRQAERR